MRSLMPLMIATPPFLQCGLARSARRQSAQAYRRSMKVGLIFNVCYLVAVGIVCAVLFME